MCACVYAYMYVCMLYVCMHALCMYVYMYACMHACIMYVCMHALCMYACIYVCMHACRRSRITTLMHFYSTILQVLPLHILLYPLHPSTLLTSLLAICDTSPTISRRDKLIVLAGSRGASEPSMSQSMPSYPWNPAEDRVVGWCQTARTGMLLNYRLRRTSVRAV